MEMVSVSAKLNRIVNACDESGRVWYKLQESNSSCWMKDNPQLSGYSPSTGTEIGGKNMMNYEMYELTNCPSSSQNECELETKADDCIRMPCLRSNGGSMRRRSRDHKLTLTARIRPVLFLLRALSLCPFVDPLPNMNRSSSSKAFGYNRITRSTIQTVCIGLLLKAFLCVMVGLNLWLFIHNIQMIIQSKAMFGFLHATTINSVITGIKPLINVMNLAIFGVLARTHQKLLGQFDKLDQQMNDNFGVIVDLRRQNVAFVLLACAAFTIPGLFNLYHYKYFNYQLGVHPLMDFGLIGIPYINILNMIPLLYFEVLSQIIRKWINVLKTALHSERGESTTGRPLKFFFRQFVSVTDLQESMGHLFNPFIILSLGWSVFSLCLTIYFITQSRDSMDPPPGITDPVTLVRWNHSMYFNIAWTTLQVLFAIIHIMLISASGTKTNEESRSIMSVVLCIVSEAETESDRFQILCFMQKLSTQYVWGISAWKAFPMERSVFFTLVSLIITYAFLLHKLKGDGTTRRAASNCIDCSPLAAHYSNSTNATVLLNATSFHEL